MIMTVIVNYLSDFMHLFCPLELLTCLSPNEDSHIIMAVCLNHI